MTSNIIALFYSFLSTKVQILCVSNDVKFFVFLLSLNQKFKSYYGSFFYLFLQPLYCITIILKMSISSISTVKAISSDFISLAYTSLPKWFWKLLGVVQDVLGVSQIYSSMSLCSDCLIVLYLYHSEIGLYAVVILIGQSCQGYIVIIALKSFYGLYRGIVLLCCVLALSRLAFSFI